MTCHVCGCRRSLLQAVTNLAPSVRAQVAQYHSQLPTDAGLCSLCIRYCQPCQPCPFFAATPAATTLTNTGMVTSTTSCTSSTTIATSSCTVSASATSATATTSGIATTTASVMATTSARATTSATTTNATSGAVKKSKPDVCTCLLCCCGQLCLCMKHNFFGRLTTFRQVIKMPLVGFEPACYDR